MQNKTEFVGIAKFVAKEGKEQDLLRAMQALLEPTRKEAGCVRYELHQCIANPKVITMLEKFTDEAAFNFHIVQLYIINFLNNIIPELVESSDVTFHREIV